MLPELFMSSIKQPDLNPKMRAILIDWLVDVHVKFNLKPETLYLCILIIDRYISKVLLLCNKCVRAKFLD
jgi:cyclin B